MPGAATTLQFDGRLTNIATQYKNETYLADEVLPRIPVTKKVGVFKTYDKADRFTIPATEVGEKSQPNEVTWGTGEDTYACQNHGLQDLLTDEAVDNADAPITPQQDTVEFLTLGLMNARQTRVAELVMNPANYAASNKADKAHAWDTASTATAVTDIFTAIDTCFMQPTIMVMPLNVWRKLQVIEQLVQAIHGVIEGQFVLQDQVAKFFGLEKVLVGNARVQTANREATEVYGRIWETVLSQNACVLLRVKQSPGVKDVVFGGSFNWKNRQTLTTRSNRGAFGGQEIRVVESIDEKLIAADVGYNIFNVIA